MQVGNPFLEKLLMEACVGLVQDHRDWIVGLQDFGAAGLTSSSVECAARGESGLEIDVDAVPRREAGMSAYDVMLSESQERMLVIAKPAHVEDVRAHFAYWDLDTTVVGTTTAGDRVRVREAGAEVAAAPIGLLTDPPSYVPDARPDPEAAIRAAFDPAALPDVADANAALLALLAAPNIADKRWVTQQYDQQVLTNTVLVPGSDAGVVRIKGSERAIAVCTDGAGRAVGLDPWAGAARSVCEAARNVACTGARPLAVTDCLNFGNPERPEIYYQLREAVRGLGDACRALGTPVVSGNASLYNESSGVAVTPTPVVGMLGVLDDVSKVVRMGFRRPGDAIWLLGGKLAQPATTLGGGEFLAEVHGRVAGPIPVDLAAEAALVRLLVAAADRRLVRSAHDCSDGGLAVALAECRSLVGWAPTAPPRRGRAATTRRSSARPARARSSASTPPTRPPWPPSPPRRASWSRRSARSPPTVRRARGCAWAPPSTCPSPRRPPPIARRCPVPSTAEPATFAVIEQTCYRAGGSGVGAGRSATHDARPPAAAVTEQLQPHDAASYRVDPRWTPWRDGRIRPLVHGPAFGSIPRMRHKWSAARSGHDGESP